MPASAIQLYPISSRPTQSEAKPKEPAVQETAITADTTQLPQFTIHKSLESAQIESEIRETSKLKSTPNRIDTYARLNPDDNEWIEHTMMTDNGPALVRETQVSPKQIDLQNSEADDRVTAVFGAVEVVSSRQPEDDRPFGRLEFETAIPKTPVSDRSDHVALPITVSIKSSSLTINVRAKTVTVDVDVASWAQAYFNEAPAELSESDYQEAYNAALAEAVQIVLEEENGPVDALTSQFVSAVTATESLAIIWEKGQGYGSKVVFRHPDSGSQSEFPNWSALVEYLDEQSNTNPQYKVFKDAASGSSVHAKTIDPLVTVHVSDSGTVEYRSTNSQLTGIASASEEQVMIQNIAQRAPELLDHYGDAVAFNLSQLIRVNKANSGSVTYTFLDPDAVPTGNVLSRAYQYFSGLKYPTFESLEALLDHVAENRPNLTALALHGEGLNAGWQEVVTFKYDTQTTPKLQFEYNGQQFNSVTDLKAFVRDADPSAYQKLQASPPFRWESFLGQSDSKSEFVQTLRENKTTVLGLPSISHSITRDDVVYYFKNDTDYHAFQSAEFSTPQEIAQDVNSPDVPETNGSEPSRGQKAFAVSMSVLAVSSGLLEAAAIGQQFSRQISDAKDAVPSRVVPPEPNSIGNDPDSAISPNVDNSSILLDLGIGLLTGIMTGDPTTGGLAAVASRFLSAFQGASGQIQPSLDCDLEPSTTEFSTVENYRDPSFDGLIPAAQLALLQGEHSARQNDLENLPGVQLNMTEFNALYPFPTVAGNASRDNVESLKAFTVSQGISGDTSFTDSNFGTPLWGNQTCPRPGLLVPITTTGTTGDSSSGGSTTGSGPTGTGATGISTTASTTQNTDATNNTEDSEDNESAEGGVNGTVIGVIAGVLGAAICGAIGLGVFLYNRRRNNNVQDPEKGQSVTKQGHQSIIFEMEAVNEFKKSEFEAAVPEGLKEIDWGDEFKLAHHHGLGPKDLFVTLEYKSLADKAPELQNSESSITIAEAFKKLKGMPTGQQEWPQWAKDNDIEIIYQLLLKKIPGKFGYFAALVELAWKPDESFNPLKQLIIDCSVPQDRRDSLNWEAVFKVAVEAGVSPLVLFQSYPLPSRTDVSVTLADVLLVLQRVPETESDWESWAKENNLSDYIDLLLNKFSGNKPAQRAIYKVLWRAHSGYNPLLRFFKDMIGQKIATELRVNQSASITTNSNDAPSESSQDSDLVRQSRLHTKLGSFLRANDFLTEILSMVVTDVFDTQVKGYLNTPLQNMLETAKELKIASANPDNKEKLDNAMRNASWQKDFGEKDLRGYLSLIDTFIAALSQNSEAFPGPLREIAGYYQTATETLLGEALDRANVKVGTQGEFTLQYLGENQGVEAATSSMREVVQTVVLAFLLLRVVSPSITVERNKYVGTKDNEYLNNILNYVGATLQKIGNGRGIASQQNQATNILNFVISDSPETLTRLNDMAMSLVRK